MSSEYLTHLWKDLKSGLKWICFGLICGAVIGTVSAVFANLIVLVTGIRTTHGWLIFLLPLAGLGVIFYYHILGADRPRGTNLVLDSIRNNESVPVKMAPLIIVSTVITHLFGGSVGREGAALQVGGSLGYGIGHLLHFHKEDRRRMIMCGMAASFSALFGTPLAATMLAMEITTVGIMYHSALLPCVVASLTAHFVAEALGASEMSMIVESVPEFTPMHFLMTAVFAICCAMVSVLFCVAMHKVKHQMADRFKNPYIRVLVSGILVVIMTMLVGDQTYNGTGSAIISACIRDSSFHIAPYGFLLKILFTAVTLSGGYQGGEIVPSLFIGATFGNACAHIFGLDPALAAAIGMTCVFCGVTNCPIASLMIAFEMFGFNAAPFFMAAVAMTYLFSGNYGIYASQKIHFSKFDPAVIDENTH